MKIKFCVVVLVIASVLTVWLRLKIVRTTYEINQLEKMITSERLARDRVTSRLSSLRSPRRLEILARTKFKLGPPRADQVIYLR